MLRIGQIIVTVKHIFQIPDNLLIQRVDQLTDPLAVIVGEDHGIDQHTHAQADGRVPNAAQSVGKGLDIRRGAQQHHDEAGIARRVYDVEGIVKGDHQNDADARGHQGGQVQRQERDSHADICEATLANGTTRNELRVLAAGENTQTHIYGMTIASQERHVDNFSTITHAADRGRSDQTFRYIVLDRASGAFEGSIEVCHGARYCEAFQSNRNLLGSAGAKMHTRPQLLIYNDDVKCSHGATTGQLDSRALFYMRSRGIPEDEARHMLMQAFMAPVVQSIPLEPLRDRLSHLIDIRLSGNAASCADCGICADGREGDENN